MNDSQDSQTVKLYILDPRYQFHLLILPMSEYPIAPQIVSRETCMMQVRMP